MTKTWGMIFGGVVLLLIGFCTEPSLSQDTKCDSVKCSPNRRCAIDENGEPRCVCDVSCDSYYYYSKVCGSDHRTYKNYCALKQTECITNTNITVVTYGECQYQGLCEGISCPSNRKCGVSGNRPVCVCDLDCSSTWNYAICGSDNVTYINECDLRKESCLSGKNISVAHYGECPQETVCVGFKCPVGRQCAVNETHKPVCVCMKDCPYSVDTVCGSDNKTYVSECQLQRAACLSNKRIKVASKGFCLHGTVCDGHNCSLGKVCTVEPNSDLPVCVCNEACSYETNLVCGTDNVTYLNECWLKRQACLTKTNIKVARNGRCIFYELCNSVTCPPMQSCVVDVENRTSCVCNSNCGDWYYPVCGSDNKTYDSYCQLNYEACRTNNTLLTYNYYGECSEGSNCTGVYCDYGKHCDSLNHSEPTCVCNTVCPIVYSPVCGSDNKTYNNYCELRRSACLNDSYIYTQFTGTCEAGPGCSYTYCPYGQACILDEKKKPICVCSLSCYYWRSKEVCGTDGKTYSSDCILTATTCLTNTNTTVLHQGQCKADSPCATKACSSDRFCDVDLNGEAICVCNEDCPSYGSPVCGSDNVTYINLCELKRESCLNKYSITWLYYGKCVEASACDDFPCPTGQKCSFDERNQPVCVCIDECLDVQYEVCGSDGYDYINECELQKEACMSNTNTTMVHRGNCGKTCGSITCDSGRICAMNEKNEPTCVCNKDCSKYYPSWYNCYYYPYYYCSNYYSKVCGNDGHTYENLCLLQSAACLSNKNIEVVYNAECENEGKLPTTTPMQKKLPTTTPMQRKLPTTTPKQRKLPTTTPKQSKLPTTTPKH